MLLTIKRLRPGALHLLLLREGSVSIPGTTVAASHQCSVRASASAYEASWPRHYV
jgi:hypothetical protein